MTLTLTIDDSTEATRLVNNYCKATGYTAASGLTKADWVRKNISDYLKQLAKRGEIKQAAATIGTEIDAIVIH